MGWRSERLPLYSFMAQLKTILEGIPSPVQRHIFAFVHKFELKTTAKLVTPIKSKNVKELFNHFKLKTYGDIESFYRIGKRIKS